MLASTIHLSKPMPMNVLTLPEKLMIQRSGVVFLHPILRPILTKQDLITHFRVANLKALRRNVLTNDVLCQCGITEEDYRCKSIFTVAQSVRLYDVLGINWLRTNQKSL